MQKKTSNCCFRMKVILFSFPFFVFDCLNAQTTNNYKTIIGNAGKVNFVENKRVDKEINYYNNNNKSKIYFIDTGTLDTAQYTIDKYTFGNIDSSALQDVNIKVDFSIPLDTAFISIRGLPTEPFNPFNKKALVRDVVRKFSPDRKEVIFSASYLAPTITIDLVTVYKRNTTVMKVHMFGVGKLY